MEAPTYKMQFLTQDGTLARESTRSQQGLARFLRAVAQELDHADALGAVVSPQGQVAPTRIELHDANGERVIITRDN